MKRSPLMIRCDALEQRITTPPGPAYVLRRSPYRWNGLGWLMEVDRNLDAVAFVLAMQHNDAGVKALIREITPDCIANSDRKPPTERQLDWLCEYLRALWPAHKNDPLVQQWLQRYSEIEGENHEHE